MKRSQNTNAMANLGTAIGVGLMAGLAGTIAMTLCQKAEMKVTGRKGSVTPANAVREVFDIKPVTEGKAAEVSNEIHVLYGTSLGIIRGVISLAGLRGLAANAVHLAVVWGGSLIMLPKLRVAPPVYKEKPQAIITDLVHHITYVMAAGAVYDAINKQD